MAQLLILPVDSRVLGRERHGGSSGRNETMYKWRSSWSNGQLSRGGAIGERAEAAWRWKTTSSTGEARKNRSWRSPQSSTQTMWLWAYETKAANPFGFCQLLLGSISTVPGLRPIRLLDLRTSHRRNPVVTDTAQRQPRAHKTDKTQTARLLARNSGQHD